MSGPFANVSLSERKAQKERDAKRFAEMRESLARLVKNADFRAWFGYIDYELCGASFGQDELNAFTQGKRATMDFLRSSLAVAEGGPEFLADLTRNHFAAIAKAKVEARRTKETENT